MNACCCQQEGPPELHPLPKGWMLAEPVEDADACEIIPSK